MKKSLCALLFYGCATLALADQRLEICYGYGCLAKAEVVIAEARWKRLDSAMRAAVDAETERKILSRVIGQLYAWAGEQTPVRNDRGGNYADEGREGAMDCIDHSRTTYAFLMALERRRILRWHRVLPVQVRRTLYVFEHYSAAIEMLPQGAEGVPQSFVVDSWFVDNGEPAVILPLDEWKNGAGPDV